MLLGFRFVQGLGSALTLVVIMSTVRDVSRGATATKLFALLMTIEGVAPILAPALGGFIDSYFGWRAVMLTLAIFGIAVLINSWLNLPETLATEKREPLQLGAACRTYLAIGCDRRFLLPTLAVAAVFFFPVRLYRWRDTGVPGDLRADAASIRYLVWRDGLFDPVWGNGRWQINHYAGPQTSYLDRCELHCFRRIHDVSSDRHRRWACRYCYGHGAGTVRVGYR